MITQEDIDDIRFDLGLLELVRDGKYEIGVGIPKESEFRKILARFIRIKNMEGWLYLAIFITAVVGIMVPFYGKLPMLFLITCLLILEAGLLCMVYDQKPALDDAKNNKRIQHQYKDAEKHARELMKRYLEIAYNEDTAHNIEEALAKQDTLTLIGDYLKMLKKTSAIMVNIATKTKLFIFIKMQKTQEEATADLEKINLQLNKMLKPYMSALLFKLAENPDGLDWLSGNLKGKIGNELIKNL